jgi:hypothetical protein
MDHRLQTLFSQAPNARIIFRYIFSAASRPALGPSQPLVQWVPAVISLGIKWLGREVTSYLHLVPRSRMVELYLHSLICLHGIVLN